MNPANSKYYLLKFTDDCTTGCWPVNDTYDDTYHNFQLVNFPTDKVLLNIASLPVGVIENSEDLSPFIDVGLNGLCFNEAVHKILLKLNLGNLRIWETKIINSERGFLADYYFATSPDLFSVIDLEKSKYEYWRDLKSLKEVTEYVVIPEKMPELDLFVIEPYYWVVSQRAYGLLSESDYYSKSFTIHEFR